MTGSDMRHPDQRLSKQRGTRGAAPTFRARFGPWIAFVRSGAAGGVVLIAASALALLAANTALHASYESLLAVPVRLSVGAAGIGWPLHAWINDGLMALFFLLVGLEIRREITGGQLSSAKSLAGPAIAALGGMALPALIFVGFVRARPEWLHGWAVPVATDIAFSLAVLQVLGSRVPVALKVFLTALAILDDLGAIVVIALFYTADLDPAMLGWAVLAAAALWGLGRLGVRALPVYLLGGVLLWWLVLGSGVHATLAGVVLAFVVPMGRHPETGASPAEALEHLLGGWVAYLVLPLFGFANAGLDLRALPAGVLTDPLVLGIALGLFCGKPLGVFGATWVGLRCGLARLPGVMTLGQLAAVSVLCGIGFTMSLFIGDLAFRGTVAAEEVRLAVLAGSLAAALAGLALLALVTRPGRAGAPAGPNA